MREKFCWFSKKSSTSWRRQLVFGEYTTIMILNINKEIWTTSNFKPASSPLGPQYGLWYQLLGINIKSFQSMVRSKHKANNKSDQKLKLIDRDPNSIFKSINFFLSDIELYLHMNFLTKRDTTKKNTVSFIIFHPPSNWKWKSINHHWSN